MWQQHSSFLDLQQIRFLKAGTQASTCGTVGISRMIALTQLFLASQIQCRDAVGVRPLLTHRQSHYPNT